MIRSKTLFVGEEWDLVFLLPLAAYKLWTFQYRCEYEDTRTSFPSEDTILRNTGLTRKTLYKARTWLKTYGWLVQTSVAWRGHNPTFRVERGWIPGHGCQEHRSGNVDGCLVCVPEKGYPNKEPLIRNPKEGCPEKRPLGGDAKVSGSGSVSVSGSDLVSTSPSASIKRAGDEVKDESPNQQTAKPKPLKPKTIKPKLGPDGTPYPKGFDTPRWSNAERLQWIEDHKVSEAFGARKEQGQNQQRSQAAKAKAAALDQPPDSETPPMLHCTACSFDDDPGKSSRDGLCIDCWNEKQTRKL